MAQLTGKALREACGTFTPAQWAHATIKILGAVGDPGAAHNLARMMKATSDGEDYSEIIGDAQSPKDRLGYAKLRRAKLIVYEPIMAYGAQRAKVNWGAVAALVGEIREAKILGAGYGMKAMF